MVKKVSSDEFRIKGKYSQLALEVFLKTRCAI